MDMILLVVPGISQILSVYFRIFGWQIHMYGKNGNFYGSTNIDTVVTKCIHYCAWACEN